MSLFGSPMAGVQWLLHSHAEAVSDLKNWLGDELEQLLPVLLQCARDQKKDLIELVLALRICHEALQQKGAGIKLSELLKQWSAVQYWKEHAYDLMNQLQQTNVSPLEQAKLIQSLTEVSQQARLKGLSQLELDIQAFFLNSERIGLRLLHVPYWQAILDISSDAEREKTASLAYQALSSLVTGYWSDPTHESWPQRLPDLEKLAVFLAIHRHQFGLKAHLEVLLFIGVKMIFRALEMVRSHNKTDPSTSASQTQILNQTLQHMQFQFKNFADPTSEGPEVAAQSYFFNALLVHVDALQQRLNKN